MTNTDLLASLKRVEETHYAMRPQMRSALKMMEINPGFRAQFNGAGDMLSYFETTFGQNFFDMGTMTRLGTAIELGLRAYYMSKKGHSTLADLQRDPAYKRGVFQRLIPKTPTATNTAIAMFKTEVSVDLTAIPEFGKVQESMLHRHLYAHNSGLLDDQYIEDFLSISGVDLRADAELMKTKYPNEDIYWFRPLSHLPSLIQSTREFLSQLP